VEYCITRDGLVHKCYIILLQKISDTSARFLYADVYDQFKQRGVVEMAPVELGAGLQEQHLRDTKATHWQHRRAWCT
jgi:hypothetical protein